MVRAPAIRAVRGDEKAERGPITHRIPSSLLSVASLTGYPFEYPLSLTLVPGRRSPSLVVVVILTAGNELFPVQSTTASARAASEDVESCRRRGVTHAHAPPIRGYLVWRCLPCYKATMIHP